MGLNEDLAYQLYQVAHEKYGCAASALDNEQHQDAVRIAKRKIRIEEAVLSSSEATRVAIPPTQIKKALEEINGKYQGDSNSFYDDLENMGIDEDYLQNAISRELHVNAVLDYVAANEVQISPTDVSLYYYMNIGKFNQPEIRTARHILVTVNEETEDNSRENSLKRIQQISSRLQKKPDRFEEQALKHSECPTSLEGGLLGKVKQGILYPEVEKVLFSLKVGQLSDIVESPMGFHIVRCDEIQEPGVVPLEDVQEKLHDHLVNKNKKQAQRNWLNRLLQSSSDSEGGSLHG